MAISKDYLYFESPRENLRFGKSSVLVGRGWLHSSPHGTVFMDVVSQIKGAYVGVCQVRLPLSDYGPIELAARFDFDGDDIYVDLCVNGISVKSSGWIPGDTFIVNTILWNAADQVLYEYKIQTPKVAQIKGVLEKLLALPIDHLSFYSARDSFRLGQDVVICGSGCLQSSEQGQIFMDVVSESDGEYVGVCQAKIDLFSSGRLDLEVKFVFDRNNLWVELCVNGILSVCPGIVSGNTLIADFVLLNGEGQVLYEYKIMSSKPESAVKPLQIQRSIRLYAPSVIARDAIGNYCLWLYDFFTKSGLDVVVYADGYDIVHTPYIRKVSDLFYEIRPTDMLFVVYSTYDRWLGNILSLENLKMLSFQNVTPATFYLGWDDYAVKLCEAAVAQFADLEKFDVFASSTNYTAEYLSSYFSHQHHFTIAPPFGIDRPLSKLPLRERSNKQLKLLCVGRVVPNKGVDEIIKVFAEVLQLDPGAELNVVGFTGLQAYVRSLEQLVAELHIPAHSVRFTGSVSDEDLNAYYREADVLLCMSKHEGFCVPLFEAMSRNVLVCATNQGAVEEVLGGRGVLFDAADPALYRKMAESIVEICGNDSVYNSYVEQQFSRAMVLAKAADGTIVLDKINNKWI